MSADQERLLRIEILLKGYMLFLVLLGCLILQLTGFLKVFRFPVGRLGATLFFFFLLNAVFLYFLKRQIRSKSLFVWVGVSDILFLR